MNFVIRLSVSRNQKSKTYVSILVIVDWLIKIIYYKLVKFIIDVLGLLKVIIDIVVSYHSLLNLIVNNFNSVLILKFESLLCYFLNIKQKLSIAFQHQLKCQTKKQKNIIKAQLQKFVNYQQNNQAKLLPMAKFVYINTKNTSTSYIFFKLNCGFHFRASYIKEVNL